MRRLFALVIVCLSVGAAGCIPPLIAPPGPAPLRYRDDIFAGVTKTSDVTYGSAPNRAGPARQSLELDIYRADRRHRRRAGPRSCGSTAGRSRGGNKTSTEIVAEANAFAKKGYVNVSINYRLWQLGSSRCRRSWTRSTTRKLRCASCVPTRRRTASTRTESRSAGTSAGAITAEHVAYNSEDPGTSGNPGYSSDRRRRRLALRREAHRARSTPANRRACCSTGRTTRWCPTSGR